MQIRESKFGCKQECTIQLVVWVAFLLSDGYITHEEQWEAADGWYKHCDSEGRQLKCGVAERH